MSSQQNPRHQLTPSQILEQQRFSLKIAYFCSFVGRGSLIPFLGVILNSSRKSSLLMIGIATNVGAIARVVASIIFATSLSDDTEQETSNANIGSNTSSSSVRRRFRRVSSTNNDELLKKILLAAFWVAGIASCAFILSSNSPLMSAISVAALLCASSIGSLILDSLSIKIFNGNNNSSKNEATDASAEYGKVRMFGSIGWGIAAPLQVALMTFLYKTTQNDASQQDDCARSHANNDINAWFPEQVEKRCGSANNNATVPLYGTIVIYVFALVAFTFAIKNLPVSSHGNFHQDDDHELDGHEGNNSNHNNNNEPEISNENTSLKENNDNDSQHELETVKNDDDIENKHRNEPTEKAKNHSSPASRFLSLVWSLRIVLLLAVLYGICDDSVVTFLFPFLRNELNVPSKLLGVIPTVNVISELPVLYLTGWLNKKFSIFALHAIYLTLWVFRFCWYIFVLVPNETESSSSSSSSRNNSSTNSSANYYYVDHEQLVSSFKILSVEALNGLCFAGAFVLLMRHTVELTNEDKEKNSNDKHGGQQEGGDKCSQVVVVAEPRDNFHNGNNVQGTIPLVHSAFFGVASMVVGLGGGGLAQRYGVRMLFSLEATICLLVAIGISCRIVLFGQHHRKK